MHLRNAQAFPVALSATFVAVTYLLFALRWRLLLSFKPKPSLIRTASFLMLGYLGNLVLPLRAGDATRVVLIRNAYGYGSARAVSSIFLERLLDVLVIVLFGAGIAGVATLPNAVLVVLRAAAVVAGIALLAVMWLAARPAFSIGVVERIVRPFGARKAQLAAFHLGHFSDALVIVFPRDPASTVRMLSVIGLTVLGWGIYGAAMILCLVALDVHPVVAGGLLLMVVTNLGSAIPSSPGSIGVYHALGVLALSPWHVGVDLALSAATITHAVVILVQLTLGLLALALVGKRRAFATPMQ